MLVDSVHATWNEPKGPPLSITIMLPSLLLVLLLLLLLLRLLLSLLSLSIVSLSLSFSLLSLLYLQPSVTVILIRTTLQPACIEAQFQAPSPRDRGCEDQQRCLLTGGCLPSQLWKTLLMPFSDKTQENQIPQICRNMILVITEA